MTDPISRGTTPAQTVGPFLAIALHWPDGPDVVAPGTPAAIRIGGRLTDGAGAAVPDGLIETWQVGPPGCRGFGRCCTDADGRWAIHTLYPSSVDGLAPHIDVSVFARGLLHRLVTRIYFPGAAANATDPVLARIEEPARSRLVAVPGQDELRFDIVLQGPAETPFFTL